MRRAWCLLLGAVLLLLAACSSSSSVTPIVQGFRCCIEMEYDGTVYKGVLDRTDDVNTILTVHEPPHMNGLTMMWNGDSLSVTYGEAIVQIDNAPAGAAVKVLCEALDDCVGKRGEGLSAAIDGESSCGDYRLYYNEESGLPETLEISALPLNVRFSEWQI